MIESPKRNLKVTRVELFTFHSSPLFIGLCVPFCKERALGKLAQAPDKKFGGGNSCHLQEVFYE